MEKGNENGNFSSIFFSSSRFILLLWWPSTVNDCSLYRDHFIRFFSFVALLPGKAAAVVTCAFVYFFPFFQRLLSPLPQLFIPLFLHHPTNNTLRCKSTLISINTSSVLSYNSGFIYLYHWSEYANIWARFAKTTSQSLNNQGEAIKDIDWERYHTSKVVAWARLSSKRIKTSVSRHYYIGSRRDLCSEAYGPSR